VYRLATPHKRGNAIAVRAAMNCSTCSVQAKMADRQGVEINYRPDCRGVWVDRGGLDKIIDRSGGQSAVPRRSEGDRERYHDDRHHESEGRRRKSFFSELFD
jgi:uncharacterized protein